MNIIDEAKKAEEAAPKHIDLDTKSVKSKLNPKKLIRFKTVNLTPELISSNSSDNVITISSVLDKD